MQLICIFIQNNQIADLIKGRWLLSQEVEMN